MTRSVFEIVGPVMIGPSSSHTAGMARIGMMAHRILNQDPVKIHLDFSPKLRTTYTGHRSDAAIFGGAIGFIESSVEIRRAIEIAHERGIETSVDFLPEDVYPQNSCRVSFTCADGSVSSILGTSIGGGSIKVLEVEDVPVSLEADAWHLVLWSDASCEGAALPQFPAGTVVQQGIAPKKGCLITCISLIREPDAALCDAIDAVLKPSRKSLVHPVLAYGSTVPEHIEYASLEEAAAACAKEEITLSELAIRYEAARSGLSREEIVQRMTDQLGVMKESVKKGQEKKELLYGLVPGDDGKRLYDRMAAGLTISGKIIPKATAMAIGVMEYNAAMGCIVAAPTAGSSGIVPGCVVAIQEEFGVSDEAIVKALFAGALIGVIMDHKGTSFSGSVGGCQAEIGVSSAIAATTLASIFSDDVSVSLHAMALCVKNLLGLVCDPIAGPIEVPCIKRNAVGVANAFITADMALAGIQSFIPPDEVIDALIDAEQRLPNELRCATIGGLACTKTAHCVRERLCNG